MATSGIITGPKVKTLWLTFEWQRTGVDVVKNASTIKWALKLNSSSSLSFSADKSFTLKINGADYSGTFQTNISWADGTHEAVIRSGTSTIVHDSDGSKEFDISALFNIAVTISGTYIASLSLAGKQTLTAIARATIPVLSIDKMQMGDELTITLNRASNAYSHKLKYNFEGSVGVIADNATTSAKWTVPRSLAEAIPNSYHGVCIITCETYNGTKLIGATIANLTLTVNSLDYPSITSISIEDAVTGLNTKFGAFIQNKSKAKITVRASGVYGSTIKSYEISALNLNVFKNTLTTDIITVSGEIPVVVKVTDSRKRSVSTTKKINVLPYTSPTIEIFNCSRSDSSGTEDIYGTYLSVSMKFLIDSLNNKNDKTYVLEYQEQGASTWSQITSGSVYTYDDVYIHTQAILNADNPYLIRLTISDYFSSISYTGELSTAFVLVDFHQSGTGVAIGKVAEEANLFDVALPTLFRNDVSFLGKLMFEIDDFTDDLNNALDPGFYYINTAVANRPESAQGFLIVLKRKAGTRMQIYITLNAKIWIRSYQNSAWKAWTQA